MTVEAHAFSQGTDIDFLCRSFHVVLQQCFGRHPGPHRKYRL